MAGTKFLTWWNEENIENFDGDDKRAACMAWHARDAEVTALEAEIANWKDIAKQAHEAAEEANAHVKLERAAFARKAAKTFGTAYGEAQSDGCDSNAAYDCAMEAVRDLVLADLPALDERDRETMQKAAELVCDYCGGRAPRFDVNDNFIKGTAKEIPFQLGSDPNWYHRAISPCKAAAIHTFLKGGSRRTPSEKAASGPKFRVGQHVFVGSPPTERVIREIYFSDGQASVFAPQNVFRYRFEGCDDSYAPIEELLSEAASGDGQ